MVAKPNAADLLAFAENNKNAPGFPCSICALPEVDLINEARRNAPAKTLGGRTVRRYLIARCGYDESSAPTRAQIDHHFYSGHHLR